MGLLLINACLSDCAICTSTFLEMYENNSFYIMQVFIDDFSIFGDSFELCSSNLDRVFKRCKEANLVLN